MKSSSDSRHLDKIKALLFCVISNESFKNNTSDKVSAIELYIAMNGKVFDFDKVQKNISLGIFEDT
jgi:hypothetical protein